MALSASCGYRGSESLGMTLVRSSSFGRKRIALTSGGMVGIDRFDKTLTKQYSPSRSSLETLPEDILIHILCGVEHDDLKRLFFVSKSIRKATLIAKHSHFAYKTPRKKIGFVNAVGSDDSNELDEFERAPKQIRIRRPRLDNKKLADVSTTLFTSAGAENWPRRELFMGMDS